MWPVSVVENRPTSTKNLFYRALRSLGYPVEFQEVDHQSNSLWVITDSPENLDKVASLEMAARQYDMGRMLRDIGRGRFQELGMILKGDPEAEINYKPPIRYRVITSQMWPDLERCFVMAYQVARRDKVKGRQQYRGLYQQFTKRDVRSLDPETMGKMWYIVIQDIQTRNPELVP